jgi:hypothetical protein
MSGAIPLPKPSTDGKFRRAKMKRLGKYANPNQQETDCQTQPHHCQAYGPPLRVPNAKVACGLQHNCIKRSSERSVIVSDGKKLDRYTCHQYENTHNQKPDPAI